VESEKEKPEATAAADRQRDQQQTKEEENKEKLFEPEFEKLDALAGRLKKGKWSFALDFSINTTSGNTNEETTRLGTHIKRTLPRERMTLDGSYYHKKNRGAITDNEFTIGLLKDWLNPGSRWFFFGTSRYDYDEFESWQQRANIQVGPGYNLIESDNVLLNFRVGAGGRKEWGSQNDNLKLEGLAGIDFECFDDYRTRSSLNWRYKLSKELNLSLLLGLLHEYQSIVNPDRDNSDTRVYTGLQIEF